MPSGSSSRPSIGKASTSVTSSRPRCSRFSRRISAGDTNARPTSPSAMPSSASTRRASSAAAASSTCSPLRLTTSTATIRLSATLRPGLLGVQLVGLDDPLDELVPDDVPVPEADEGDAVDGGEDVLHLDQAGRLLPGQVDLRHVAGD